MPRVVGQTVQLNGTAFTVIGIAPETFTGTSVLPMVPDFWAPVSMQAQLAPGSNWLDAPDDHQLQILGRLKDGVPFGRAQAEADLLIRQFGATHTERDKTLRLTLQRTSFFGNTDDPRFQAFVAGVMLIVGLVLLVACANIANLLLARTAGRQREIAVRLAMGASRGRVIRQLLTESVVLALAGRSGRDCCWPRGAAALLWVAIEQVITGPFAGNLKLAIDLSPDVRVYAYALLLSIATGILFGLWPALRATRPDLISAMRDEGTGFGAGWTRSRLRGWLVGGQVAVSMLLLITAGLLARGLVRSRAADPGFDMRGLHLLTADFGHDPAKALARQRRVIERLRMAPGGERRRGGRRADVGDLDAADGGGPDARTHAGQLCRRGLSGDDGNPAGPRARFFQGGGGEERAGGGDQRSRGAPLLAGGGSAGAAIPTRSGFPRNHVGVRGDRRGQGCAVRQFDADRHGARVSHSQGGRLAGDAAAHARRCPPGAGRRARGGAGGGCRSAAQSLGDQHRSRAAAGSRRCRRRRARRSRRCWRRWRCCWRASGSTA